MTIFADTTVQDLIRIRAVRCTFGKGTDPDGVCRVWLCAIIPHRQTFVIINHMVMRPAGFVPQPEMSTAGLDLLQKAEVAATYGLGDGLQNWTND